MGSHALTEGLVDDKGESVEQGALGEIVVQGPQVMSGYWQQAEETAKSFIDGRLHTGDVGYMDSDGYVFIVDRKKDMFTESFVSKSLIHSDLLSMSRLYNYHTQSPILHQQELQTAGVEHLIKDMHQEFLHGPDYAKEDMLRLQLKMLLLKAERAKRAATVGTRNAEWVAWFRRYKLLIKEQYAQTRNAADYANSLGISYKHLNQICKSMVGMTAKGVIDNAIVLDIKKRLATTNVSIKTLTFDMGFDEPTNLVKFFKKKTGLTPAQFKLQLQG